MGTDSRALAQRFGADTRQQAFLQALSAMSRGGIVALPGGVRFCDPAGELLGAIGVAGAASEQDEACALAAIRACGLRTIDG